MRPNGASGQHTATWTMICSNWDSCREYQKSQSCASTPSSVLSVVAPSILSVFVRRDALCQPRVVFIPTAQTAWHSPKAPVTSSQHVSGHIPWDMISAWGNISRNQPGTSRLLLAVQFVYNPVVSPEENINAQEAASLWSLPDNFSILTCNCVCCHDSVATTWSSFNPAAHTCSSRWASASVGSISQTHCSTVISNPPPSQKIRTKGNCSSS